MEDIEQRETRVLPISNSSEDFLVSSSGGAVWPTGNGTEAALRTLAECFDATLVETDATVGTTEGGDEVVLALGQQNADNGRLYAHLTCRQHRVATALDAPEQLENVAVIVCQWDQLTYTMLDLIHEHGIVERVVGLIVGHEPGAMREQLMICAAAAFLPGTDDTSASMIYTEWHDTQRSVSRIQLLGSKAGGPALRQALSRGASVVSISGHGDGLDMQLGEKETLCGVVGGDLDNELGLPDCVSAGYCYRTKLPLKEALQGDGLVDPRSLRTRIGIFSSCFTIPARGALVHPRWSLLAHWIDSPSVGAVLAPFGLSMLSRKGVLSLAQAVLNRSCVGDALHHFDRGEEVAAGRVRMCLFGDPRTRVPDEPLEDTGKRARSAPPGSTTVGAFQSLGPEERFKARCELLCRALAEAKNSAPNEEVVDRLAQANGLIQSLAKTGGPGSPEIAEAAQMAISGLHECLPVWHLYPYFSSPIEELPGLGSTCVACGERVRTFQRRFPAAHWPARWLGKCDRCGMTCDVEEGSPHLHTTFNMTDEQLDLPGALNRPAVQLSLTLRPWHRKKSAWQFPADGSARTFTVATGATSAYILALDTLEIVFLRRQLYVEGPRRAPEG